MILIYHVLAVFPCLSVSTYLKQGFFKVIGFKDDDLWNGAKSAADDFIVDYKEKHNGAMPSFQSVQDVINNAGIKPAKPSFLSNGNSGLAGYEKLGIRQAVMVNMGLADAEDNGNGSITLTYDNGQTVLADAKTFKAKIDEIEKNMAKKW